MTPTMHSIRRAQIGDCSRLLPLRVAPWPDGSSEEHRHELDAILSGGSIGVYPYVIFVATNDEDEILGFAEVTLRSYADGCDPATPVGYLEGWYVVDAIRRRGIGKSLFRAGEEWAINQGCRELASDTQVSNHISQAAHNALGFEIVETVVLYKKLLRAAP